MSDLVERLRAANTWLNEGDCCGQLDASGTCMAPACIFGEALKMAHEAADRIEQLEAALQEIKRGAVWNADIEAFISAALEERA